MKKLFLFFVVLNLSQLKAQVCDSVYPEDPSALEKTAVKFKEKLTKGKKITDDASLCFEVAQHLRRKKDTLAAKFYYYACDLFKKNYMKEKKAAQKVDLLYKLGLCYFYMSDFKQAEVYFAKSIKCKGSPCNYYYLYLCKKAVGKNEEAEIELNIYKKETGN